MIISWHLNQNYDLIKEQCISSGVLFEDPEFPACESSLFKLNKVEKEIFWKRPHEFLNEPKFILDKVEPNLRQGCLGNCWFISGVSSLSTIPEYFKKVVPCNQTFDEKSYAGIFYFIFWHNGNFVGVVVDDRLPVDENNQLLYCYSDKNEFYGPLLEKAYAKLATCYEFLIGGNLSDSLVDLTGGVSEFFKLKELEISEWELWEIIFKSFQMKSLAGAVIKNENNYLEQDHSYCILEPIEILCTKGDYDSLRTIRDGSYSPSDDSIKLLKMRNPWGSDTYDDNEFINESIRDKLGLNKNKGEFYINFSDFIANFDELYLVHTNLNAYNRESLKNDKKWIETSFKGYFKPGLNAGGCGNEDYDSYWRNPRYLIKIEENTSSATIIVSLVQTSQTKKRLETDGSYERSNEPVSFSIFNVKDQNFINKSNRKISLNPYLLERINSTGLYTYQRQITKLISLNPGYYLIIPSTFDKDVSIDFVLRVFTNQLVRIESLSSSPLNGKENVAQKFVNLKKAEIKTCSIL